MQFVWAATLGSFQEGVHHGHGCLFTNKLVECANDLFAVVDKKCFAHTVGVEDAFCLREKEGKV